MSDANPYRNNYEEEEYTYDPYAFAKAENAHAGSSSRQPTRRDETREGRSSLRGRKDRRSHGINELGEGAMDVDQNGSRGASDSATTGTNYASNQNDVLKLMRAWQEERHAPDILPARDELLGRVLDAIRQQVSTP